MQCLYYLAPTLNSARIISDDLHAVGIKDWYLHVISKDEAGLKKERVHSSNYMETMDLIRAGLFGACLGFSIGVLGAFLIMAIKPFGPNVPAFIYIAFIMFATCFGAWEGGLYGIATENRKLAAFHDDIAAGKYLFLVYTRRDKIEAVREMMQLKHPGAQHVASDEHFIDPFSNVTRSPPI